MTGAQDLVATVVIRRGEAQRDAFLHPDDEVRLARLAGKVVDEHFDLSERIRVRPLHGLLERGNTYFITGFDPQFLLE